MLNVLLAAVIGSAGLRSDTSALAADTVPIFRSISDIAARTCQSPQDEGWAWNAHGNAQVYVNVDKLKQVLGSAGVSLSSNGDYDRWHGPLQKDVGTALLSRNDCAAKVFVAMVQYLPLSDSKTGKSLAKPAQPLQTYQRLIASVPVPTAAASASNNSNGAGQQLNVGAPSTNIQIAGPTSSGGPAIQNNYFPPVTADQKQQAHEALLADLTELGRYPERGAVDLGPSIAQQHFRFKVSRALYLLLAKYNYFTIATVSGGDQLNKFEADYYAFESNAPSFEQLVFAKIGADAPQRMTEAWHDLFEYSFVRALGFTPEQFAGGNGQTNFGITPEQEEMVFQKLMADPTTGPSLKAEANFVNSFTSRARELLRPFQTN